MSQQPVDNKQNQQPSSTTSKVVLEIPVETMELAKLWCQAHSVDPLSVLPVWIYNQLVFSMKMDLVQSEITIKKNNNKRRKR